MAYRQMDFRQPLSIKKNPFQDPSVAQQVSHCASLTSLQNNACTGKEEMRPQTSPPKDTSFLYPKLLSPNHQNGEERRQGSTNKCSFPENGYGETPDGESNSEDDPLLEAESTTGPDPTDVNLIKMPNYQNTLEKEHSDTFNKASSGKLEKRDHLSFDRFLSFDPQATRGAVSGVHFSRNSSNVSLLTAGLQSTSRQTPNPVRRESIPSSCTVDVTGNEDCAGADASSTIVNIDSDTPDSQFSDPAHSDTGAANPSNSDRGPQSHEPRSHKCRHMRLNESTNTWNSNYIIFTLFVLVVFILLFVLFLFGGFVYLLGRHTATDNNNIDIQYDNNAKALGVSTTNTLSKIVI